MWIAMSSSAKMPNSCRGTYRRVAVVQLSSWYTAHGLRPAMISERAKGVLRVLDLGKHSVGLTDRCAFARTMKQAEEIAHIRNNVPCDADIDLLTAWGGSA